MQVRDRAIRFAQETSMQNRAVEFALAGAEPALFKCLFSDWPSRISSFVATPRTQSNETAPAVAAPALLESSGSLPLALADNQNNSNNVETRPHPVSKKNKLRKSGRFARSKNILA
jgi:hypothetical protein